MNTNFSDAVAIPESPADVQALKAQIWAADKASRYSSPKMPSIVAKGDSWFDYLPGLDILDFLKHDYQYNITKISAAGDTAVNMAWGSDTNSDFTPSLPAQIEHTVEVVKQVKPKFFLLSAGGNDIAGNNQFLSFLNHSASGLEPLRESFAEYQNGVIERAYRYIFQRVFKVAPTIHIVLHGYGNADLRPTIEDGDWVNELHLHNSGFRKMAARFHDTMVSIH
jgi:hypothetical protein